MKIKTLLLLSLTFALSLPLKAQLKKGDFFSTPVIKSTYYSEGSSRDYQLRAELSFNTYRMASDKVMVAAEASVIKNGINTPNFRTDIPGLIYNLAVEMRRYFHNGKVAPFFFARASYGNYFNRQPPINFPIELNDLGYAYYINDELNDRNLLTDIGIGCNFFLSPDVAIELKLGHNFIYDSEKILHFRSRELFSQGGFKLLFRKDALQSNKPLKDRYLKTGNIFLSGDLHFQRQLQSEIKFYRFIFQPEASLFISNRTEVMGRLAYDINSWKEEVDWNGLNSDRLSIIDQTISAGLRHHLPLNEQLYLAGSAALEVYTQRYNSSTPEVKISSLPLALDLVYFKNQSRYFFGCSYKRSRIRQYAEPILYKHQTFNAQLGFDYFFRPAIYLRSELTTVIYSDMQEWESDLPKIIRKPQRLNLSFTFGFLIGGEI